jgi:hypothetical protein
MKLPDKFYCGFKNHTNDDVPLGFMTPWGSDKAFEKRKNTVDNWSRSKSINPVTFDNIPVMGFKLGRAIKRSGWNGGNTVVRVEDPRGFEVEISVGNLLKIMVNNIVENGEIMAECIWGRDGNNNILLATNSEPYIQAVENTERSKRKISVKDVKPGMRVRLQNGTEGVWLGNYFGFTMQYKSAVYNQNSGYCLRQDDKKRGFLIVNKSYGDFEYDGVEILTTVKISDIIDDANVMTEVEAEQYTNAFLNRPCKEALNSEYFFVSTKKVDTVDYKLVPATYNDIISRINSRTYVNNSKKYYFTWENGVLYSCNQRQFVDQERSYGTPTMGQSERRFCETHQKYISAGAVIHKYKGNSGIGWRGENLNKIFDITSISYDILEASYTSGTGITYKIKLW